MRFNAGRGAGTAARPLGHGGVGDLNVESATRRALLRGAAALSLSGFDALFAPSASANALRVGEPAPLATLVSLWNYLRRGVPATWEVAEGTR